MVISKKCKVCGLQDASNVPISGEYYGKQIPELIQKISGIELDPRKLNGILLCQQCTIMLVHTEGFIDRLCKSIQRLRVPSKLNKTLKTAVKEKKVASSGSSKKASNAVEAKENGEISFKKIVDDSKPDVSISPPTNNVKRKLSYNGENTDGGHESSNVDNTEHPTKRVKHKSGSADSNTDDPPEELQKCDSKEKKRKKCNSQSIDDKLEPKVGNISVEDITKERSSLETKRKDLNCVLCGKPFSQKSMLREHIESSHMGEKLKECPNCFMEFRSQQKYESHVFNEKCKTTLHPCQFENCNRRFKNAHRMEMHMQEKHLSQNGTEGN